MVGFDGLGVVFLVGLLCFFVLARSFRLVVQFHFWIAF